MPKGSTKEKQKGKLKKEQPTDEYIQQLEKKTILDAAYNRLLSGENMIDTKLYAYSRRMKEGGVDKPLAIYACSGILRHSSSYFDTLLVGGFKEDTVKDLDTPIQDEQGDMESYGYESDSDLECEDDDKLASEETMQGTTLKTSVPANVKEGRPESRESDIVDTRTSVSILKPKLYGRIVKIPHIAFTTLRALIYYLGTGRIAFAPLKALNAPRPSYSYSSAALSHEPLPCSPKSMYRVADMLQLSELKTLARDNIRTQLTPGIILRELLSNFTSRFDEISQLELKYFLEEIEFSLFADEIPQWTDRLVDSLEDTAPCRTTVHALIQRLLTSHHSQMKILRCEHPSEARESTGRREERQIVRNDGWGSTTLTKEDLFRCKQCNQLL